MTTAGAGRSSPNFREGKKLAQGLNSARSAPHPSHEAIEDKDDWGEGSKNDGERMVHAATTIRICLRISLRRI